MIRTPEQWATAVARNRALALAHGIDAACQITHGRYFWPLDPKHPGNDYDIEFIAHSLSTKIRWAGVMVGSVGQPLTYSVAQHAVHVADIANLNRKALVPGWDWDNDDSPASYGLHHDDSEAYIMDVPRPLKPHMGGYKGFESGLMDEIISTFNVPLSSGIKECVRRADNMILFMERDRLVGQPVIPYTNEQDHPHLTLSDVIPDFHVWDAKTAKQRYLEKFVEIENYNGNHVPLEYANRGYVIRSLAA